MAMIYVSHGARWIVSFEIVMEDIAYDHRL
jgi:hypothetical protein